MTIKANSGNNYQVEITARGHEWIADEPVNKGGDDLGPSPYELLLSSLAACKIITAQMYAKRKDWPLDGISVKMTAHKVDASDCEDCSSTPGSLVDVIEGKISFEGDLTQDQIRRLHQISNRCPVQRTLTSETVVRINIQPDLIGINN